MFQIGGIFVPVTDLERSKKWYEAHLGLIKVDEWANGEDHGVGYAFPNGASSLALIQVDEAQPTSFTRSGQHPNVYYNLLVHDIDAAHKRLCHNTVVTTPIQDHGDVKAFDFVDPDGNTFSVVEEAPHSPFHQQNIRKLQEQYS